jgi:hypothetical protein
VLSDSGLRCDTFNFICRARLAPETVRAAAAEAISYFAHVERPFSWWVGPADRPRDRAWLPRQHLVHHTGQARPVSVK